VEKRVAEAAADRQRQAEERQRLAEERAAERAQNSWGNSMLLCNDGTLSPSCTCGRASRRGCCSHHGGVAGCSAN
jgi:hypothetical protein